VLLDDMQNIYSVATVARGFSAYFDSLIGNNLPDVLLNISFGMCISLSLSLSLSLARSLYLYYTTIVDNVKYQCAQARST
jgi:hypothetical protein